MISKREMAEKVIYETVEQWEERTGKTYPDDGPVWVYEGNDYELDNQTGNEEWVLCLYDQVKNDYHSIVVANHQGKPEE